MTLPDDPNPAAMDDAELMARLFPLDDADGPAAPATDAALDALVAGALTQAAGPPGGGAGGASGAGGGGGASPWLARLGPLLLVAGVTLGGGVYWATQPDAPAATTQMAPAPTEPDAPAEPALLAPEPAAAPDRIIPEAEPAEAPEIAEPSPARPRPQPTARDLLREANTLRGQGRYRQAEQLYLRVVRQHGGSSSAYVARAAAAGLRLDRLGNPRGALSLYRAALRQNPGGPLGPELRRGVALSTRRLGMRSAEERALRDFISRHGSAPFARRARTRLEELSAAEETP